MNNDKTLGAIQPRNPNDSFKKGMRLSRAIGVVASQLNDAILLARHEGLTVKLAVESSGLVSVQVSPATAQEGR